MLIEEQRKRFVCFRFHFIYALLAFQRDENRKLQKRKKIDRLKKLGYNVNCCSAKGSCWSPVGLEAAF